MRARLRGGLIASPARTMAHGAPSGGRAGRQSPARPHSRSGARLPRSAWIRLSIRDHDRTPRPHHPVRRRLRQHAAFRDARRRGRAALDRRRADRAGRSRRRATAAASSRRSATRSCARSRAAAWPARARPTCSGASRTMPISHATISRSASACITAMRWSRTTTYSAMRSTPPRAWPTRASRERDQIVTTRSTVEGIYQHDRPARARSLGSARVLGKQAPIEIVDVLWQEDLAHVTTVQRVDADGRRGAAALRLLLRFKSQVFEVDELSPPFTIGRDAGQQPRRRGRMGLAQPCADRVEARLFHARRPLDQRHLAEDRRRRRTARAPRRKCICAATARSASVRCIGPTTPISSISNAPTPRASAGPVPRGARG